MSAKRPTKSLRVLLVVPESLIPPETYDAQSTAGKEPAWLAEYEVARTLRELGHECRFVGLGENIGELRKAVWEFKPAVVFNLTEDFNGVAHFDQNIVSFLELLGIPYTGCNPRGLVVARDKSLAKKILRYHQLATPSFEVFSRQSRSIRLPEDLIFPLVVKSTTEEASMGISQASVVHSPEQLRQRVRFIHESVQTDALVESYIPGRELYVGVLGNQRAQSLPVWELCFGNLTRQAEPIATEKVKWSRSYREKHGIHSSAAEIPEKLRKDIQALCCRAYQILGLNGYARMDLRLSETGEVFFLEANPNCHIGEREDFAQSARSAGISYPELLQKVLNLALRWQPNLG